MNIFSGEWQVRDALRLASFKEHRFTEPCFLERVLPLLLLALFVAFGVAVRFRGLSWPHASPSPLYRGMNSCPTCTRTCSRCCTAAGATGGTSISCQQVARCLGRVDVPVEVRRTTG